MDLKDEQWAVVEPLLPKVEHRADGKGTSESGRPCDPEWYFVGLAYGSTLV